MHNSVDPPQGTPGCRALWKTRVDGGSCYHSGRGTVLVLKQNIFKKKSLTLSWLLLAFQYVERGASWLPPQAELLHRVSHKKVRFQIFFFGCFWNCFFQIVQESLNWIKNQRCITNKILWMILKLSYFAYIWDNYKRQMLETSFTLNILCFSCTAYALHTNKYMGLK